MKRPRSTARVQVEDLFAEMHATLRASVLESLHTLDRALRKREEKEAREQAQPAAEERPSA